MTTQRTRALTRRRTLIQKALALAAVLLMLAVVAPPSAATAQDWKPEIEKAVVEASDAVVQGKVIGERVDVIDGIPFTVWTVEVAQSFSGPKLSTVEVVVEGGELPDGRSLHVSHQAEFEVGDEVQLGLTKTAAAFSNFASGGAPAFGVTSGAQGAVVLNRASNVPHDRGDGYLLLPYSGLANKWPSFALGVQFKINFAGSPLGQSDTLAATQRGFSIWEGTHAGSPVDFVYAGSTNAASNAAADGINSVFFTTDTAFADALTWRLSGKIYEVDIRINPTRVPWSNGARTNHQDLGSVVAHEVGHGLGLDHFDAGEPGHIFPPQGQIMHYQSSFSIVQPLGQGDRNGIARLYPAYDNCANVDPSRFNVINMSPGQPGHGTQGADLILGTPGIDVINAKGGDDVVCAGDGIDKIYGGDGKDLIYGEGGSDWIWADDDADLVLAGSGADRVFGGNGNDRIQGQGGQDFLYGEAGDDDIQGNWQSDRIWGGPGNDVLRGAAGKDKLYGDAGNDLLYGGDNTDYLDGGPGYDTADGQRGRDYPLVTDVSGCIAEQQVSC